MGIAITHAGASFPGIASAPLVTPVEHHTTRTHFAAVDGVSEIDLGTGLRQYVFNLWLYGGFSNQGAIQTALQGFDALVGQNGVLTYLVGGVTTTVNDVTFDGWQPSELGPLPDVAGTLDGGWWCEVVLYFTQLTTN